MIYDNIDISNSDNKAYTDKLEISQLITYLKNRLDSQTCM